MKTLVESAGRLASTSVAVLIEGETGVGKEVLASAIHRHSRRSAGPFVVVDCGALPVTLLSTELFGHEKGSFTGADRRHVGAFERAHGGTIFLDEIGELPLEFQPALLGVLERRRFRRVGGNQDIEADVRLISATNRDLRAGANSGQFRPDLYYRIAVSRLVVPPLRERTDDIPELVAQVLTEIEGSPDSSTLDPAFIQSLARHYWPGNVRELRNAVEQAVALGTLAYQSPPVAPTSSRPLTTYKAERQVAVEAFEREYLQRLISQFDGNASAAARFAEMDRNYLVSLLRRHGLR